MTKHECIKAILILKHKVELWLYGVGDLTIEEWELFQSLANFQRGRTLDPF